MSHKQRVLDVKEYEYIQPQTNKRYKIRQQTVEVSVDYNQNKNKESMYQNSFWNCCTVGSGNEGEIVVNVDKVREMRSAKLEVDPPFISPIRMREREQNSFVNYNIKK